MLNRDGEDPAAPRDSLNDPAGTAVTGNRRELSASARAAIWELRERVRAKARSPVYALLGADTTERTDAAQALCEAEGGCYIRLSDMVGERLLSGSDNRLEWVDARFLAAHVIELAQACAASLLVVDDWEFALSLAQSRVPGALLDVLRSLVYRELPIPIVLALGPGPGGYGNITEVRSVMETEGRQRVVALVRAEDGEE